MTDELEDLKEALASAPPPAPEAKAQRRARDAALRTFDAAAEELPTSLQGSVEAGRRRVDQPGPLAALRRRLKMTLDLFSTRTAMLGGASLGVLVLALVAIQELRREPGLGGLETAETLPTEQKAPAVADRLSREAPARFESEERSGSGNRAPANRLGQMRGPSESDERFRAFAPAPEEAPVSKPVAPVPSGAQRSSPLAAQPPQLRDTMTNDLNRQVGNHALQSKKETMQSRMVAETEAPTPGYHDQGRDNFEDIEQNRIKVTAEEPVSTFSIDVDTASYSFVRASLMNGVLPQKDAVRIEELINYFPYDYASPESRETPFRANVELMPTPWNADTQLMRIGIKGYDLSAEEKPRSNLVFLIDTSGSMNTPNKLPLLINSFRMLVGTLDPDDTISIVAYAGSAGTVLEPTEVSEKGKILASLDRLHAGGSTAGGEGIRQAYRLAEANFQEDGINRVILATDGDFNVGITDIGELEGFIERKRETGIFLSVLGFGQGNYNDALMQALAQNGNGTAAYVDTLSEARKTLVEEASSTLFPIAKDVKIQVEFNPATVAEYRLIGYETRLLNREDFNNDRVDAGEIGSGHTVTALYEITPVGSPAHRVDNLRYQADHAPAIQAATDEYAFLKIRYKQPEAAESELITLPVTTADEATEARTEIRFAAAVAAFGELLRGGQHSGDFDYDDVIALANGARGDDPFGYRTEFVNLARLAKSAADLEPQRQ